MSEGESNQISLGKAQHRQRLALAGYLSAPARGHVSYAVSTDFVVALVDMWKQSVIEPRLVDHCASM